MSHISQPQRNEFQVNEYYESVKKELFDKIEKEIYDENGIDNKLGNRVEDTSMEIFEQLKKLSGKNSIPNTLLPKFQISANLKVLLGLNNSLKEAKKFHSEDMKRLDMQNTKRNINNYIVSLKNSFDDLFQQLVKGEPVHTKVDTHRDTTKDTWIDTKIGTEVDTQVKTDLHKNFSQGKERLDGALLQEDYHELQRGISEMQGLKSRNLAGNVVINLHYDYRNASKYKDFPAGGAIAIDSGGKHHSTTIDLWNRNVTLHKRFHSLGSGELA